MRHSAGTGWQQALVLLSICLVVACLPCTAQAQDAAPRYGIGTPASADDIAAWDIDVRPDGQGLPPGQGHPAEGETLYRELCEHCHGEGGSGGPFGGLVGRQPGDAFPFGRDPTVKKTVGNYWPYATTLFDYIRRAMPFESPGSLDANAVYSLVAYLLRENRVIAPGEQLDQDNLADIRMPARDRFVPDDRRGGEAVR